MLAFIRRFPSLCVAVFLIPMFRLAYYLLNWMLATGQGQFAGAHAIGLVLFGPGMVVSALGARVLPFSTDGIFYFTILISFGVWLLVWRFLLLAFLRKYAPENPPSDQKPPP